MSISLNAVTRWAIGLIATAHPYSGGKGPPSQIIGDAQKTIRIECVKKLSISRINTVKNPNTAPTANKNVKVIMITTVNSTRCHVGQTPLNAKNIAIITSPNKKFTNCVIVNDNGNKNFGKYT